MPVRFDFWLGEFFIILGGEFFQMIGNPGQAFTQTVDIAEPLDITPIAFCGHWRVA